MVILVVNVYVLNGIPFEFNFEYLIIVINLEMKCDIARLLL